jgi:hypothetical protein
MLNEPMCPPISPIPSWMLRNCFDPNRADGAQWTGKRADTGKGIIQAGCVPDVEPSSKRYERTFLFPGNRSDPRSVAAA